MTKVVSLVKFPKTFQAYPVVLNTRIVLLYQNLYVGSFGIKIMFKSGQGIRIISLYQSLSIVSL